MSRALPDLEVAMPYQLREDLSFCQIGDQVVFLDTENDRYFKLSGSMKHALSAFLENGDDAAIEVNRLVDENILVEMPSVQRRAAKPITRPCRSAIERPPIGATIDVIELIEVFAIVYSTWRRLRKRRLKTIIGDLVTRREKKTGVTAHRSNPPIEHDIARTAIQFNCARRYVPFQTSCLLDSLSLVSFLSRRHLRADIVFGVTLDPFSAHCWVQFNDMALNETVSDANVYTPIRMV